MSNSAPSYYLCQNENGKFNIKHISDNWTINSFVVNEMAREFLGKENISEVRIEKAKGSRGKKKFVVTNLNEDLEEFEVLEYGISGNGKILSNVQLPYNWKLNAGGYNITSDGVDIIEQKTSQDLTYYNGKVVSGFYEALIFSVLVRDHDIDGGNNFALLEKDNEYIVTRYDFDDAFKFYDVEHIAKFQMQIPEKIKLPMQDFGITTNKQFSEFMRKQLENITFPASSGVSAGDIKFADINKEKASEVITKLEGQFSELLRVVDEAYEQVGEIYSAKELKETYNLKKLNCHKTEYQGRSTIQKRLDKNFDRFCNYNEEDTPIDQIKEYTKSFLRKRMDELLKAKICFGMPYDTEKDVSEAKISSLKNNGYSKFPIDSHRDFYLNEEGEALFCYGVISGQVASIPVD